MLGNERESCEGLAVQLVLKIKKKKKQERPNKTGNCLHLNDKDPGASPLKVYVIS